MDSKETQQKKFTEWVFRTYIELGASPEEKERVKELVAQIDATAPFRLPPEFFRLLKDMEFAE